ncbi:MAG: 1,4-dihydroxy-2-naphthoate polyprenyltransferase [Pseudonocardia sp.]|uniref:1,4-dihydroxy-2-naphthoate polyprenyltransferase n=1 Tax=unclassified Pseudonocardia TaxID=2619320 RepID=UPI00086B9703|nr:MULTISPECIES: 1,4-dihydroxy-2-naphthoate polyprenyltransferase [unclassified Pseudonocardia]MBN9108959.1 1,4-dihydroxy-2-naphthoate polyprenyltransferase [Pseudonocardia sp.]ODU98663.1 MAG: 1,4-dihydroxy-2-naphthoate polyprenyltransferase [Pseudonocardia sp. SCN 73-27]
MATAAQWIEGARPRTLPTAISPVLVGTGAALGSGVVTPGRALLALVVAMSLVIAVNYANDYSDGIRGTDDDRVGPLRLVGSKAAAPAQVKRAAFIGFGIAAVAGLALVAISGQWWLLVVGAVCILGAWFYTGGKRPYGYAGLGEVAVFVFFGPVAVLGTVVTQSGAPSPLAIVATVGVGLLTCAVLVANNLRDIPTDARTGKRTLAVALGDADTRKLYAGLILVPLVLSIGAGTRSWPMFLGLLAAPLAVPPVRRVLQGADGRKLVKVLQETGVVLLAWSVATAVGLALGRIV